MLAVRPPSRSPFSGLRFLLLTAFSLPLVTATGFALSDAIPFAALAALALITLAVWVVADQFLVRRMRALVRLTRELGAGEFDARAPRPYGPGELGELELAFNAMADSIRRREVAILESEGRFREIAETVQEAFWVVSPDGRRIPYMSPAFEKIWGRPVAWLEGGMARLLETVDPEDRPRVAAAAERMAERGFNEEYRILHSSGDVRWISSRAVAVRDPEGRVVRIIGSSEDLTERKRMESQFLQSQKMEALGRLAGGVAHDFNNLLTVISGYADMLLADEKVDGEKRQQLQEIAASARRATSLTRQLLAFSRKQAAQRELIDLNDHLHRMENMLRRLIGENLTLVVTPGDGLGAVMGDPGHIEQTIMNLVVNARDAMPRGGTVRIETANVELDEAYAREHAGVTPGPFVMLAVSDTGVGMSAATRARLFEPFFTTKKPGQGTGLGLATVYGIAKQSGGHIWVYSEPDRGSTFKIYFPRAAAPQAATTERVPKDPVRDGKETILVVEDDPDLRLLVRTALENRGYSILETGDGDEAKRISDSHPGQIHLLLTDSVLPRLSGPALSRELIASRGGLRVLFMSGYTNASVSEQAGVEVGRAFLQKPFTLEALARKVREVLDEKISVQ
jgi:PAS domain S-box-containing protein